jgi:hypothetical protein
MTKLRLLCLVPLTACGVDTNNVDIELAPQVISSIDGTLDIRATATADTDPVGDQEINITVAYTDRNGTAHDVAPVSGKTDHTGVFETAINGLIWDGSGTVTAALAKGNADAVATFAVLDRSPPKAVILPPASNQVRLGTDVTIQVHVTDEIGISQGWFESNGQQGRQRSSVVASGSSDSMLSFDFAVPDNVTVGSMITLYALAADLSGNEAAAVPVVVTVTQ